jgi:hypothetical protein
MLRVGDEPPPAAQRQRINVDQEGGRGAVHRAGRKTGGVAMSVKLDRVAPWGRSFDEYRLMFQLTEGDLRGTILGCGDGPASFNAEATAKGCPVVSCDPIYTLAGEQIRTAFEKSAGPIMSGVKAHPQNYVWSYHASPDELLIHRRAALEAFLLDYESGRRQGRYVVAALPTLPFRDGQFDLAVCSHLLFLYSDLLGSDFHVASMTELCRVAREVRIFPLLDLECETSKHVAGVTAQLEHLGMTVEIVVGPYQRQRNGNQMMRIRD